MTEQTINKEYISCKKIIKSKALKVKPGSTLEETMISPLFQH
jgi:hypothetical protein